MRPRLVTVAVTAAVLVWTSAAVADATTSANWAGYAVHRPRVSFRKVSAVWRQPSIACTPGSDGYSAFWVGLGGYKPSARALEQIGTEADCRSSGRVASSAWYELIPAPTSPIGIAVQPGDVVMASVTVGGHRVTLQLYDATRHRGFKKTVHAARVDVSSAEWIAEAPSACLAPGMCETLPLANFGVATFGYALAQSARGHLGPISDSAWHSTMIRLRPGAHHFVVYTGSGTPGAATPSALLFGGSSFQVSYSQPSAAAGESFSMARDAYLVHPGR